MDLKGLVSISIDTSIVSAITAAERLLSGGNGSDPHLNCHDQSFNNSLDPERILTSNKILPLIPYLKQCGDLV